MAGSHGVLRPARKLASMILRMETQLPTICLRSSVGGRQLAASTCVETDSSGSLSFSAKPRSEQTSYEQRTSSHSEGAARSVGSIVQQARPALSSRIAPCQSTQLSRGFSAQASTASTTTTATGKHDMFCFQCEQTRDNVGCMTVGVCGKDPQTAALQDLLVHSVKGFSQYAMRAKALGVQLDSETNFLIQEAVFSTLTNVNFDPAHLQKFINEVASARDSLKAKYEDACRKARTKPEPLDSSPYFVDPPKDLNVLTAQAKLVGIETRREAFNEDIFSVQELITYGIKGTAAYAAHAHQVSKADPLIADYIYEAFDYMAQPPQQQKLDKLVSLALRCGQVNMRTMEILNEGHKHHLGIPEPSQVRTTAVKGKCIAVSGHDLKDLYELLKATEGKGINVYTHGEMLPAHGYPKLKQFKHLVGNYGGAWMLQKLEFAAFPGPVLMTTNCLVPPKDSYSDRVWTQNAVGHPKLKHLEDRKFEPLIQQALSMEGFTKDEPERHTMTGFGHDAVLGIADTVVDLVKQGKIKRFFLIGGCDGWEGERSYYKELATKLPKDAVVLTLACGKYRFNKLFDQFGTVEGTSLPRLLDIGQCNDAYSALRIADALAKAFKTDVNSLPLSLVITWFEQKAVAVLLTLLHLGITNIRVGPKLPAFITPNVLNVLVDKFKLTPISDVMHVEDDIKEMMARGA